MLPNHNEKIHSLVDKLSLKNPHRSDGESSQPVPDVDFVHLDKFINRQAAPLKQIGQVQQLLCHLEYNFLPTTFFNLRKNRPLIQIITTAKEVITESLPIRCLEATFVGIYLTQHLKSVARVPIAFKSLCSGRYYRHIVLAIRVGGVWGTVGLSRRSTLMDKPVIFASIAELMDNFIESYAEVGHELSSFKLGLEVSHDSLSKRTPCWRFISVSLPRGVMTIRENHQVSTLLTRYQEMLPKLSEQFDAMLRGGNFISNDLAAVPIASPFGQGDEDEDGPSSDTEENQQRIRCVMEMQSPFAPSPLSVSVSSSISKVASRLRGVVRGNSSSDANRKSRAVLPRASDKRPVHSCPPRRGGSPLENTHGGVPEVNNAPMKIVKSSLAVKRAAVVKENKVPSKQIFH